MDLRAPVPLWLALLGVTFAVVAAVLISAVVLDDDAGSTSEAVEAGPTSTPAAEATVDWRDDEYARIAQLAAGLSLDHFRDVLGTPLFVTESRSGAPYTQYLFRRPGFWVQSIADTSGSVQFMAVTACDADFHPEFRGIEGSFPALSVIRLGETALADTGAEPDTIRYLGMTNTGNRYFIDEYYFGNPGNYKTYYVGINDACPFEVPDSAFSLPSEYNGVPYDPADTLIADLRANAIANTYAETAVFFDEAALESFYIGPDRILTRTAPPLIVE